MRCPKCNHEQHNTVECDVCGVIFARYQKIQDRKKEAEALKEAGETKPGGGLKLLQVVILIVAVAATTYYFAAGNKSTSPSIQQPEEDTTAVKATSVQKEIRVVKAPEPQTVSQQPTVVQGNAIEQARNATVSIETPWGTGSGFFINKNYIVTNRHVVQFDEKKLAELRENVGKDRKFYQLEQEKIEQWKQQYKRLPQGPARSQLAMIIDQHEEELKKVLPMLLEKERRLQKVDRKIQPSDIKIILADGSSYAANYVLASPGYDLALMSLFSGDRAFIPKPPAGSRLHQGDKIYAIGSPVGLRHTVTAGIFSGYREQGKDGRVYLQTDAAINPGNSGGPLIDENGYARGVATMILQNTEGIGFAIPIDKVYEEFNSSLF